ncbi:outer membrane protein [Mesorhizobium sp. B1-1-8]|uniref:outer membrane protein n=1 Tax=Mesorhizobium sp. B1-1-8 TaxID=2589976 RepID=UPI00112C0E4C|nr:outer membrane protein [Mesorhizobium sp. B1-1-8]UCI06122.1 porin family protein [Mesorhizobium sp. B1-1-8]
MKQLLLATVLVLATGTAYAADVLQEAPVAASFDWTGAYIGANAGGGFGTFKLESPAGGGFSFHSGGFLGGIQAGYNWQSGQMVYGVETDFQGSDVKATFSSGGGEIETKVDWFGTLRARIGFTPVDRFMVYGTGGLAYGHEKTTITGGPSFSKTRAGWTVGAGAEYAINTNWTIKSEYLYTDLGKETFNVGPTSIDVKVPFHTVRVGLNYKF